VAGTDTARGPPRGGGGPPPPPAGEALRHPLPHQTFGASSDQHQRRCRVETRGVPVDDVEGGQQRGGGPLVGGEQDLLGGGGVPQTGDGPCRLGQVGGPLPVEERQHDDVGVLGGVAPIESEPCRDPVDGEGAVQGGGEGEEPAGGVGESGDRPGRVDHPALRHRVGGPGGPQADDGNAGFESETDRGPHVVSGTGPDRDPAGEPQLRRFVAGLTGRIAGAEHVGKKGPVQPDGVELEHLVDVVTGLGRPPRRSGGVAPVGGAVTREPFRQVVVGETDRLGGGGDGRFVAAQPRPLGGGEGGHRHHPDRFGPHLGSAEGVDQLESFGGGADVVPQHRRTEGAVVAEDHQPVLLAGDGDGGDLPGPAGGLQRRLQRLPPHLGVGLTRPAGPGDLVLRLAGCHHRAVLDVDDEGLRRLGGTIDTCDEPLTHEHAPCWRPGVSYGSGRGPARSGASGPGTARIDTG